MPELSLPAQGPRDANRSWLVLLLVGEERWTAFESHCDAQSARDLLTADVTEEPVPFCLASAVLSILMSARTQTVSAASTDVLGQRWAKTGLRDAFTDMSCLTEYSTWSHLIRTSAVNDRVG